MDPQTINKIRHLVFSKTKKELEEWCWDHYESGVAQAVIRKIVDDDEGWKVSSIYENIFLDVILPILTPEEAKKGLLFNRYIRENVGEMFRQKYSIEIDKKTIENDSFVRAEVPKYLMSIKDRGLFLTQLWECLSKCLKDLQLGWDKDKIATAIGVAWLIALKPSP